MKRTETNTHYSFYQAEGKIIGFTGLRINRTQVNGRRQLLVYFDQTVVHHECRGKSLIPVTGAKLCLKYWKDMLSSDVYFWADALTYKAYLVFAKTVGEMYPSHKQQMPATVKAIVDHLGRLHYQQTYCSVTGTVQKEKVLVNDSTMQIPQKYLSEIDIHFYMNANPQYTKGHGLLTISPMCLSNIKHLLNRYVGKMFEWKPGRLQLQFPVLGKANPAIGVSA